MGAPPGIGGYVFETIDRFGERTAKSAGDFMHFFGIDFWGKGLNYLSLSMLILSYGLLLWIVGARAAVRRERPAIDVLPVVMLVFVVLFTSISFRGEFINDTRFLVPAFFVGLLLVSREWQRTSKSTGHKTAMALTLVASVVVAGVLLHTNRFLLAGQGASRLKAPAQFLEDRGLTDGFADLWVGHLLRVESGNRLNLIPIVGNEARIAPRHWAADAAWIRNRTGSFVVLSGIASGDPASGEKESRNAMEQSAIAYWGSPKERHEIDGLVFLLWDRELAICEDDVPVHLR